MLSIINDFIEFLNNKFEGEVPNLLYFAIGIGIGIILFLILLVVVIIIYKVKSKTDKQVIKNEIIINENYKEIINKYVLLFNDTYSTSSFKDKFTGLGKILLSMMEEISSLYYPDSEDPMFEISINQLVDFLSYMTFRINFLIDELLNGKLSFIDSFTKHNSKNIKLSVVLDLADKGKKLMNIKKDKPKKEGVISNLFGKIFNKGKKLIINYTQNATNDEIVNIIPLLGEDINKLYSKQELVFNDIAKKELKALKRNYKRQLRLSLKKGRDVDD